MYHALMSTSTILRISHTNGFRAFKPLKTFPNKNFRWQVGIFFRSSSKVYYKKQNAARKESSVCIVRILLSFLFISLCFMLWGGGHPENQKSFHLHKQPNTFILLDVSWQTLHQLQKDFVKGPYLRYTITSEGKKEKEYCLQNFFIWYSFKVYSVFSRRFFSVKIFVFQFNSTYTVERKTIQFPNSNYPLRCRNCFVALLAF